MSRIWPFLPILTDTTQVQATNSSCLHYCHCLLQVSLLCLCPLQTIHSIAASKPDHITHSLKPSYCFFTKVACMAAHLWPHWLLSYSHNHQPTGLSEVVTTCQVCSHPRFLPLGVLSPGHVWQAHPFLYFRSLPKGSFQRGCPRLFSLKLFVLEFPISLCLIFSLTSPSNVLCIFFTYLVYCLFLH